MNWNAILVTLLALLFFAPQVEAQKVLALENPRKFKRFIFEPGDYIRFGTSDSQAKFSGIIESVDESFVVIIKTVKIENEGDATNNVFRDYVPISEITKVFNVEQTGWRIFQNIYSGSAIVGGGALILIGVVNAIINNSPPDPNSLILAGSISASGLLVKLLGRNKYKIGKGGWGLRAMDPIILEEDPDKPKE